MRWHPLGGAAAGVGDRRDARARVRDGQCGDEGWMRPGMIRWP
ncbi:hypothetical protein [Sphingomonas aerolata]